jgi:ABC-type multidrug transport system fused ATPase/permease subunit
VIAIANFSMICFTLCKVANDVWAGNWATAPDQSTNFKYYCGMFFLFGVLTTVFVYMRAATTQLFSWYATRQLHRDMMAKIFNAPINLYFDVTPIGRILNKFSKDLSTVEQNFSYALGSFLAQLYQTISILVLAAIVVPWILLIFPLIAFAGFKVYTHSIPSYRQCTRIESLTKSPLLSYLAETGNGSSTIRAFKKEQEFIEQNNKFLNNNILACLW